MDWTIKLPESYGEADHLPSEIHKLLPMIGPSSKISLWELWNKLRILACDWNLSEKGFKKAFAIHLTEDYFEAYLALEDKPLEDILKIMLKAFNKLPTNIDFMHKIQNFQWDPSISMSSSVTILHLWTMMSTNPEAKQLAKLKIISILPSWLEGFILEEDIQKGLEQLKRLNLQDMVKFIDDLETKTNEATVAQILLKFTNDLEAKSKEANVTKMFQEVIKIQDHKLEKCKKCATICDRKSCPALGVNCRKCGGSDHFSSLCFRNSQNE